MVITSPRLNNHISPNNGFTLPGDGEIKETRRAWIEIWCVECSTCQGKEQMLTQDWVCFLFVSGFVVFWFLANKEAWVQMYSKPLLYNHCQVNYLRWPWRSYENAASSPASHRLYLFIVTSEHPIFISKPTLLFLDLLTIPLSETLNFFWLPCHLSCSSIFLSNCCTQVSSEIWKNKLWTSCWGFWSTPCQLCHFCQLSPRLFL